MTIVPASGSGSRQLFTATFSHSEGAAHIANARVLINQDLDGRKGCYIYYMRKSESLLLVKDAGEGTTRAPIKTGSPLSNGQCEIDVSASSASDKGHDLTLRIVLIFTNSFAGNKNIFLYAEDTAGKSTGLQNRGTWNIP